MPGKIIVVDDDAIAGDLSSILLREVGYEVEQITDSLTAIEAIKAARPVAVILDMMMPGLDGLTLCRMIKADPDLKGIKVAIVTGKSFKEDIERAAKLGADAYIVKPYKSQIFVRAIQMLLGEKKSATELA